MLRYITMYVSCMCQVIRRALPGAGYEEDPERAVQARDI